MNELYICTGADKCSITRGGTECSHAIPHSYRHKGCPNICELSSDTQQYACVELVKEWDREEN